MYPNRLDISALCDAYFCQMWWKDLRFTENTSSMFLSKQIVHINMNIKPFCRGEFVQIGCLAREKLLWVKYNILSPHLLSNVYLMIKKSLIGLNLVWLEKCWVENWLKFSSINFPLAPLQPQHSHILTLVNTRKTFRPVSVFLLLKLFLRKEGQEVWRQNIAMVVIH